MCFFGGNVTIRPDGHRFSLGSFLPLRSLRFLFFELLLLLPPPPPPPPTPPRRLRAAERLSDRTASARAAAPAAAEAAAAAAALACAFLLRKEAIQFYAMRVVVWSCGRVIVCWRTLRTRSKTRRPPPLARCRADRGTRLRLMDTTVHGTW